MSKGGGLFYWKKIALSFLLFFCSPPFSLPLSLTTYTLLFIYMEQSDTAAVSELFDDQLGDARDELDLVRFFCCRDPILASLSNALAS